MKTRKLSEGLEVSDLGYGAMSLSHGYGEATDRKDAVKILRQALDCGYTYFDTAEVYGPYINEELFGEALKPFRDEVVISTKFGISFSEYTHGDIIPDARPEKIRQSVEGSLKRLQTETIDLYFQHRIDPKVEPEVVAEVMGELIKEGKIRHWGVSVAPEDYIRRAHKVTPISAVQDRYSMMARGIEKLFPTLEELGIGRPSTYAPTISTIIARRYVAKEGRNLYLTELGEVVNHIMKQAFPSIVESDFTANVESLLDKVEEGVVNWKTVVSNFYPDLEEAVEKAEEDLQKVKIEDEVSDEVCELCGRNMVVKYGPHGKFLACPGFPECRNTKPYLEKIGVKCPKCGKEIVLRRSSKGRKFYSCEGYPDCDFVSWKRPEAPKEQTETAGEAVKD